MAGRFLSLLAIFLVFASFVCLLQSGAQTTSSTQDFSFQVLPPQVSTPQSSTMQAWMDTGLDLRTGDVLEISASPAAGTHGCDPKGVATSRTETSTLPLATAPVGALLARLHAQGALPLLVGAGTTINVEESAHLYLGLNANSPICQGTVTVKVHKISAGSAQTEGQQSRKEQIKSQLESAAQIFMQGQFGMGKSESNENSSNSNSSNPASGNGKSSSAPSPLKVSNTPLDGGLRKLLDNLPRRVNDQVQNLGDMVNFVIIGSQKDVQSALDAALWHVADTSNEKAALSALEETYENKDYLQMPMSILFLFGRKQDFGYEMAEPIAMVASRHHFRIWKAPFTWNGKEVWVGAGTHDIGFAKDHRNGSVTHKIDPAVDGERNNIGSSLQKANKVKSLTFYLPPNPVQEAKNATGDGYHSDGRLLIIFLQ
jgi:hypothetical protein